ncbi:MAG: tail fiber domain-containing protein [Candidatus Micrarchaeia archaeon]
MFLVICLCQPASAGSLLVQGALNSTSDFSVGNGSFFVNSASGRVGINTSSPNATLHVVSGSSGFGGDRVYDTVVNNTTYRVHVFTAVGTSAFTPPSGVTSVECLIVAGGGGGASWYGGGGGAGGLIYNSSSFVTAGTSYPVVVGAGGAGRPATVAEFNANDAFGSKGSNSSFNSQTAIGGGGAPGYNAGGRSDIEDGGSGAGGRPNNYDNLYSYGKGVAGQGNNGAIGDAATGGTRSGGGGGAGGAGVSGATTGAGGIGLSYSISGTPTYYAGGGGGGAGETAGLTTPGGIGGGGTGRSTVSGSNADANTGGGGGGSTALAPAGGGVGGNGGSGIVIIRYQLSGPAAVFQGSVGIGTANPLATLHVAGTSVFNGSVGIGMASPKAKLHVVSGPMASGGDSVYEIVQNGVAYRVHKFTTIGNSTFTPPDGVTQVEYLVVAGGGAGGGGYGGGGGAGGYLSGSLIVNGAKIITVGAGGSGAGWGGGATSGSDSVFDTIIAKGGGRGGEYSIDWNGQAGGSGGGGGARDSAPGGSGIAGQGYAGGAAIVGAPGNNSGGGGGGSSHAGYVGYPSGGLGGAGNVNYISGTPVTYAAGGNGSAGGNGVSGLDNTGSGGEGGGGVSEVSGNGGSGIVIVRYQVGSAAVFQGSVGIGTSSPAASLHVNGQSFFNGSVGIGTSSPSAALHVVNNKSLPYTGLEIQDSSEGLYRQIYLGYAGNLYFYNGANEGYLSSAGAWTSASDASYKKDVRDIHYGLADLMLMQPRSYLMKSDNSSQVGFVAQELEKVVPEVVSGEDGRKGIAYGQLSAVIVKAVQEQQEEIDALKAGKAAQQLQIEQLKALVCIDHPAADACK